MNCKYLAKRGFDTYTLGSYPDGWQTSVPTWDPKLRQVQTWMDGRWHFFKDVPISEVAAEKKRQLKQLKE